MKQAYLEKEVLAMYDVRGIQNYIFKSNAAKEIIGASVLVANVIMDGLNAFIREQIDQNEQRYYLTDWETDNASQFLENKEIHMQVMFVGGGNAYVLFREGSICQKVNRYLAKYIMKTTYSLNLAVAVVEKTESYRKDYENINEEMRRIKAYMPSAQPLGALPFMEADSVTGYPITCKDKDQYFCTEAMLKRNAFPKQESEKVFDNMVTEKGDSSMLAVCHIDGNSMGSSIKDTMSGIDSYEKAIATMRKLSLKIAKSFRKSFDCMTVYMDELSPKVKKNLRNKLYREIIVAGDDITFVCNAKLAIPAVKYLLAHIGDESEYSACGGIAFFNSHFPFSDAYQVAESCCSSAKSRAKEKNNRGEDGRIGNYFDFQICTNISAADLDSYRQKHYVSENQLFIARPYYVPSCKDSIGMNKKNESFSVEKLEMWQKVIHHMPRNKAKMLRNSTTAGTNKREETISFLKSRGYGKFTDSKEEYAIWYDATEIMDLYIGEDNGDEN